MPQIIFFFPQTIKLSNNLQLCTFNETLMLTATMKYLGVILDDRKFFLCKHYLQITTILDLFYAGVEQSLCVWTV